MTDTRALAERVEGLDPLQGWNGSICPPHELPPETPPIIRELCRRANEWNAEGDFANEVLGVLAAYRATLRAIKETANG